MGDVTWPLQKRERESTSSIVSEDVSLLVGALAVGEISREPPEGLAVGVAPVKDPVDGRAGLFRRQEFGVHQTPLCSLANARLVLE